MKILFAAAAVALMWPIAATEDAPIPEKVEPFTPIIFEEQKIEKPMPIKKAPAPMQIPDRETWLQLLEICESGGNPEALNPVDRDGTASHGLLQFKDSTFEMYRLRYGLGDVELYDPEAQRTIVRYMMDDPRVNWEREFPDCVNKLGRPPGGK